MPFNGVLTICSNCKESFTKYDVKYEDRNKDYKCRKCSAPYFRGFTVNKYFNV